MGGFGLDWYISPVPKFAIGLNPGGSYSFDKKKRRVRRHQIIPLQFLILLPTRQGGFKNTDKVYHFKPVSNYLQTSTKAERPQ